VLLHLPPRELVLCGLVHNRGTLVIAAALGLLWEVGLLDRTSDMIVGDSRAVRSFVRQAAAAAFGDGGGATLSRILMALAGFLALLAIVRIVSVGWALVRLYGFTLTRIGEDVRLEFGLITRVVATIPLRRIQTITVRDGPLHRLSGRVSVRVTTAGGTSGEEAATQREWLAPLIRRDRVAALLQDVAPGIDLATVEWTPVHARAFVRELRGQLLVAGLVTLPFVPFAGRWSIAVFAVLSVWAIVAARLTIRHLRWAITDSAVCLRSGALWRYVTVARFAKIQTVALHESPFDRRTTMARVRVDTAGAGDAFRVDIPYLARETARALQQRLAQEAAHTAFRW
jgi:putative membrane protein